MRIPFKSKVNVPSLNLGSIAKNVTNTIKQSFKPVSKKAAKRELRKAQQAAGLDVQRERDRAREASRKIENQRKQARLERKERTRENRVQRKVQSEITTAIGVTKYTSDVKWLQDISDINSRAAREMNLLESLRQDSYFTFYDQEKGNAWIEPDTQENQEDLFKIDWNSATGGRYNQDDLDLLMGNW